MPLLGLLPPAIAQRFVRDSSFATQGVIRPPRFAHWRYMRTAQILLQPDGKIIMYNKLAETGGVEFIRLHPNGTPDSSFGTAGVVRYHNTRTGYVVNYLSAHLGKSGRIYVLFFHQGDPYNATPSMYCMTSAGLPERNFGGTGTKALPKRYPLTTYSEVREQNDGQIVLLGYESDGVTSNLLLTRVSQGGNPDPAFGTYGFSAIPASGFSPGSPQNGALTLQADGRILLTGGVNGNSLGWSYQKWYAARFRTDGRPDSSFANNGVLVHQWDSNFVMPTYIDQRPGSGIFIGGVMRVHPVPVTEPSMYWQKPFGILLSDSGTFVQSFGTGGRTILRRPYLAYGQPTGPNSSVSYQNAFYRQQDGKVLLLSNSDIGATAHFVVSRLNVLGRLDSGFCDSGVLHLPRGFRDVANSIVQQPDGKIMLGGFSFPRKGNMYMPDTHQAMVMRIRPIVAGPPATTGIGETRPAFASAFYPNPVSQNGTLEFGLDRSRTIWLRVCDIAGRTVFSEAAISAGPGINRISVPMERQPAGMYFYQLSDARDGSGSAGTFIKN